METPADIFQMSDLFGKERFLKQDGRPVDERATLVQFFSKQMHRPPKVIALRVGHLKGLADLYVLKSSFNDRLRRPCRACINNGMTAPCPHSVDVARKYFWWATRTRVVPA